ncbi:MAG TPA: hypothetical protein VHN99_04575 [Deinococcales bacterium]|nr:hypothetical protein [Deinococcales bacterium]
MKPSAWWWPAGVAVSTLVALVVLTAPIPALRLPVGLWFLLVCPGMALARACRLNDALAEFGLAVGLSLALDAIVALAMVYARAWSPGAALAVLAFIAFAGSAVEAARLAGTPAGERA